jgi:hypothetical protein
MESFTDQTAISIARMRVNTVRQIAEFHLCGTVPKPHLFGAPEVAI